MPKIDTRQVTDLFKQLVVIDSPTGSEHAVAEYILNYLSSRNTFVTCDAIGNVYARISGSSSDSVFFAAHMDTVEPGRSIRPVVSDEYITSDGKTILGADNKAAIACYLAVIDSILKEGVPTKAVEFLFTVSEESGNEGAIAFDYSQLQAESGYCFDTVSPIGTIITASPYYDRFDITLSGRSAHASRPDLGINTLSAFQSLMDKVTLGKIDANTLCNIGLVEAGTARNTIPGSLTLKGEVRGFDPTVIEQVEIQLKNSLEEICSSREIKFSIDIVRENGGYDFSQTSPPIASCAAVFNRLSITKKFLKGWAVSDANVINHKGKTCINLGDGVENAHTTEERISLESLSDMSSIIFELINPSLS